MNTLLGYSYKKGGEVSKKLKPIPEDNPGLKKLPQEIRNRMGYMQEGGSVSPRLAALLRRRERSRSQDEYEDAMRDEARKRQKASTFGGLGSFLGSLLVPAVAGALGVASGGLATPLLAGFGAAAGKKIGASSGYSGKFDPLALIRSPDSEDYGDVINEEDLIYGKDAFEDLESSARDYSRRGIDQDAIVSGLKSSLLATLGGSDSAYFKSQEGTLFDSIPMTESKKLLSAPQADFITGAEQNMFGELAPFKTSFGLNQRPFNPMTAGVSRVNPSMVSFNPVGNQTYNLFDLINN